MSHLRLASLTFVASISIVVGFLAGFSMAMQYHAEREAAILEAIQDCQTQFEDLSRAYDVAIKRAETKCKKK